ncbi:MAG: hypothetical protein JNM32_01770 [Dechloromonas sp.]|nr:hypothetical protein [Dechloromonas sp.]
MNLIAEYDASNNVLRRYVHGPGIDEPLVWYEGAGTTSKTWLYADHQGSIVGQADATGTSTAIYSYGPFGEPNQTAGTRFRYTGQQYLSQLGLYYYKARFYSPMLGRFLQTDPIGYQDDSNLYAYVGNDPVNGRDPSGLTNQEAIQLACTMCDAGFGSLENLSSYAQNQGALSVGAIDFLLQAPIGTAVPAINGQVILAANTISPLENIGVGIGGYYGGGGSGGIAARGVHGNSRASTAVQHRYEIAETASGDVVKTGISGGALNANGTSGRANRQVNALNKAEGQGSYSASVKETNLPGRQAGLDAEQAATTRLDAEGNSLRLQRRPRP